MIQRPPRSTLDRSSAASDVYKRLTLVGLADVEVKEARERVRSALLNSGLAFPHNQRILSLIHISEPTRPY